MSSIIALLDRIDRNYLRGAPIPLGVLGATSGYYLAFSYGAGITFLVLGKERATLLFGNASNHPLHVLVGVPLVPVMLVALEAYDLEGKILNLWRSSIGPWVKTVHVVGSLVEWFWPTPNREPHVSTQEGLGGTIDHFTRCLSAGLMLPFFAYALANLFNFVSEDQMKRIILGGIVFFSLKTLVKVYLRQQEYRRQGSRRVLDYQEMPPQPRTLT